MPTIVLKTEGLTKSFRGACAVDHVAMEIHRGDIYGFIGVNGAGKTTFMKMVCGLTAPGEGSIALFGASDGKPLRMARRKIGALIEHPAFYPNMTALENLEIQRRYLHMNLGTDRRRVMTELLEQVGLADTGHKRAGAFSLGMKQRLGLAIALIGNPELLILDEPTIGLDPVGVVELRELLVQLNRKRNLTIFFSSHNLSEMERLATRYGFLHEGRLVREVTVQEMEADCLARGIDLEKYFLDLLTEGKGGMKS